MRTLRLYDGYPHTSTELMDDVKKLQSLLGIASDGYFGLGTQQAVVDYQIKNKLLPDGIVGDKTWSMLIGRQMPFYCNLNQDFMKRMLELMTYYTRGLSIPEIRLPLIFGIGIRESRWGEILKPIGPEGTGDFIPRKGKLPPDSKGFGRGLMQIDYNAHKFAQGEEWKDPKSNILYALNILNAELNYFLTYYTSPIITKSALAAYNCGRGNVIRALAYNLDIDYYTSGRDYSKKVSEYARWYENFSS